MSKTAKKTLTIVLIVLMVISAMVPSFSTPMLSRADDGNTENVETEVIEAETQEEAISVEEEGGDDINGPPEEEVITEESLEEEENLEEVLLDEEISEETAQEESTVEAEELKEETEELKEDAEELFIDEELVEGKDFSSKRLLVSGDVSIFTEKDNVLSSVDGVYLVQYKTVEEAKAGYTRLFEKASAIEIEKAMSIAEGEGEGATSSMTESDNPFTNMEDALSETTPRKYDVAVIDTGATNAEGIVSVLGDSGIDAHGHGQKMIDTIKTIAPDANVLSIKALGNDGTGDVSAIYAAIKMAIEMDVKIINLSISSPVAQDSFAVEDAINEAIDNGIVVVGAAGNNGSDASATIPGRIKRAIIVGMSDAYGNPNMMSNTGETVDYFVPATATSISAAKVSGYIALKGTEDGLMDYFLPKEDSSSENSNEADDADKVVDTEAKLTEDNEPVVPIEEPELTGEVDKSAAILIKYLLVDEKQVTEKDTFETVMFDKDCEPVILQYDDAATAYLDGDYYTMTVDTPFRNGIATGGVLDIAFANGNDNGEVIRDGVSFDAKTYTVRIAKELLTSKPGDFADVQVQLMVPSNRDVTAKVNVEINDTLDLSRAENGTYEASPFFHFELNLMDPAIAKLIDEGNLDVTANGVKVPFTYNSETGNITILIDAIKIKDINITIHEFDYMAKIQNAIFSVAAPTVTNWLTLDPSANISKMVKGKSFTNSVYFIGGVNWDLDWGLHQGPNVFKESYVKGGNVFGWAYQGLTTGAMAIPETFWGISNFKLSGAAENGAANAVGRTEGGVKYNPGLWGKCYHANVAKNTSPGVRNAKFEVVDVTKKSDGYTYVTMAYLVTGGAASGTGTPGIYQATGGYFGFRQKSEPKHNNINFTIYKRAYNSEGRKPITDYDPNAYAVFKVEFFAGTHTASGTPTNVWHYKTRTASDASELWPAGSVSLMVRNHQAAGYRNDAMYIDDDNKAYFPEGIVKITEVATYPEGVYTVLSTPLYIDTVSTSSGLVSSWTEGTLNQPFVEHRGEFLIPTTNIYQDAIDYYNYEVMDEANLVIEKVDSKGNPIGEVDGKVTFKVEFFREPYDTVKSPTFDKAPERTWYFYNGQQPTDVRPGVISFNVAKDLDTEYDSDDFFMSRPGYLGYPQGTLRVSEVECPDKYTPFEGYLYAEVKKVDGKLNMRWTEDAKTQDGTAYIGFEEIYPGRGVMADKLKVFNYESGKLKIQKVSADPSITDSNHCYSLNGATFGIYESRAKAIEGTASTALEVLKTNASGLTGESKEYAAGQKLYIKELTPPPGYEPSNEVKEVTIVAGKDKTVTVTYADEPGTDPISFSIRKVNSYNQEIIPDTAAVFKAEYFENYDWSGTPKRTWYFKTVNGAVNLDAAHLDSSYNNSEWFADNEFPLGSVRVTEVKAPTGFKKLETPLDYVIELVDGHTVSRPVAPSSSKITLKPDGSVDFGNDELPIEIKTTASDAKTTTKVGSRNVKAEIKDVIEYKNLRLNNQYRFDGQLKDAKTGEVVAKSTLTMKATARSGKVTMPAFVYDSTKYADKTLVVTEVLTDLNDNKVVARHESLTDKDQTVYIPKIITSALDEKTGAKTAVVGKTTVVDKVTMTNLVVGQKYTATGELVYREDCTDAKGVNHKKGDVIMKHEPVTFTADAATKVMELKFTVDASALEGTSGVVFEDLYSNDVLVATHHDLIPEQTTNWPKVRTTAVDGATKTHSGVVGDKATIVDTVSLTNLTVGEQYKIVGTLMNSNGSVFNGSKSVTSEVFTADKTSMTKTITFNFNSKSLDGKDLVVFEKLIHVGESETEVARHEDLKDKNQTISYPKGHTNATDPVTEDQVGTISEEITIIDKVTYSNLVVGLEHEVSGALHYQEDGVKADGTPFKAGDAVLDAEGNPITATEKFTPTSKDGFVNLVYKVNSTLLEGERVVVTEDFYQNGIKIYSHADINDPEQTVYYPKVRTTAISKKTGDHVGDTDNETVIIDKVMLTNLKVGEKYTVNGTLMDLATKKPVMKDGKEVTASSGEFTATDRNMTINIEFNLSGVERENKTTVAFEQLIHKGKLVAAHADIDDKEQTVFTPKVGTTAQDGELKENMGRPRKNAVIRDTVSATNLVVGMEYTVSGTLMDKATGKAFIDADGKEVKAEKTFKADQKDMEITLDFTFNGANLEDKTVVVFEDLLHNKVVVAFHRDINDKKQSVDYPSGKTVAKDTKTETKTVNAEGKAVVVDTFTYGKLKPGVEYTLKGELINKETKEVIATNEITFTPEKANGSVDITFEFDASKLAGTTAVAFETVKYKGVDIIVHKDLNDPDQTVTIPKIGTVAKDSFDGDNHILDQEEQTIVDTIKYEKLEPNKEYHAYLTVYDKTEGKLTDITADRVFTSSSTGDGTVDVSVTIDGTVYAGHTLVMFEKVYSVTKDKPENPEDPGTPDVPVGVHEDPEDPSQTIYVPKIGTVALDGDDNDHVIFPREEQVIIDTVKYEGLEPGMTYIAELTAFDKTVGELTELTAEQVFTASETGNGTVDVTLNLDGTGYAGHILVMFEKVSFVTVPENPEEPNVPGDEVGRHEDPEDEDQTIYVTEIRTSAKDKSDEDKIVYNKDSVTIVDTVSYEGLMPGTYNVLLTVMDKATGEPLKSIIDDIPVTHTEQVEITEVNGEFDVEITLNAAITKGHTLVMFEELFLKGNLVAEHKDIEDEEQTVFAPNIGTTLTGNGGKEVRALTNVTLVDTVSYNNLIPGKEYTMSGELVRKDNQAVISTGEVKFTASETGEGTVEMAFTVDTTKLQGKHLVAFEKITYEADGKVYDVAEHKDINDPDQTIYVVPDGPETGDESQPMIYIAMFAAALALAVVLKKRFSKNNA